MIARRPIRSGLERAFDEKRFGPARTLDLHAGLPTAAEAVRRTEPWLRDRQMAKAGEVLVITGRGAGSPEGVGAIRRAVRELLARLKRVGVVSDVRDHGPGAFIVALAPIRALFEVGARTRGPRAVAPERPDPSVLSGLERATRVELELLAEQSLRHLGAPVAPRFVEDEMLRQFAILAQCIAPEETDREARLRFLITAARHAYEDD